MVRQFFDLEDIQLDKLENRGRKEEYVGDGVQNKPVAQRR